MLMEMGEVRRGKVGEYNAPDLPEQVRFAVEIGRQALSMSTSFTDLLFVNGSPLLKQGWYLLNWSNGHGDSYSYVSMDRVWPYNGTEAIESRPVFIVGPMERDPRKRSFPWVGTSPRYGKGEGCGDVWLWTIRAANRTAELMAVKHPITADKVVELAELDLRRVLEQLGCPEEVMEGVRQAYAKEINSVYTETE